MNPYYRRLCTFKLEEHFSHLPQSIVGGICISTSIIIITFKYIICFDFNIDIVGFFQIKKLIILTSYLISKNMK